MPDNVQKAFGVRLKELRIKQNLTQAELAHLGNFDRNYIGMLERGERNPSLKNLVRLSEALKIELHVMLKFKA